MENDLVAQVALEHVRDILAPLFESTEIEYHHTVQGAILLLDGIRTTQSPKKINSLGVTKAKILIVSVTLKDGIFTIHGGNREYWTKYNEYSIPLADPKVFEKVLIYAKEFKTSVDLSKTREIIEPYLQNNTGV